MRIDLNSLLFGPAATERQNKPEALKPEAAKPEAPKPDASAAATEDRTSLTLDTAGLSQLQTMALQQPEVRTEKVNAIRQALDHGQYRIDPGKIAEAMLNELKR